MSIFTGLEFCSAVPYSNFLWQVLSKHHFCPLFIFHFPRKLLMHHLAGFSSSLCSFDTLPGVWRFDHLVFLNPKFWAVTSADQLFVTNPFTDFCCFCPTSLYLTERHGSSQVQPGRCYTSKYVSCHVSMGLFWTLKIHLILYGLKALQDIALIK